MNPVKSDSKLALHLSWLIAVILALLPFHAFFTTWLGSVFGHLDYFKVWKELLLIAYLPFAIWLAIKNNQFKKWFIGSWIVRLYLIYVLLFLISGTWAISSNKVTTKALVYSYIVDLRFIGFFIICVLLAGSNSFLKSNWQKILFLPAIIVVFFGLVQKLFLPYDFLRHFGYNPKTIPAYQTVDANIDYRRIQSTLRGANPLGAYLVLIITSAFTMLRKNRNLVITGILGALIVLFFSYSRSAWLGFLVSAGLLAYWTLPKKSNLRWLWGVILLLVILALGSVYLSRSNQSIQDTVFHTSTTSVSSHSSNAERLNALESGAKDVWHEPLGEGPGTAGPASFRNNNHPRIAENFYLQIGQEVGVLGMIIFIAIVFLVAKELYDQRTDKLARVLLASLVGISFINLVSHAWTDDTLAYLWWGLAGIAFASSKKYHKIT